MSEHGKLRHCQRCNELQASTVFTASQEFAQETYQKHLNLFNPDRKFRLCLAEKRKRDCACMHPVSSSME